jgi:two-component system chemotaxis sensor kinase CheA
MKSELMGAFLEEVEEQLQQLEQDILHLEQDGDAERTIHSIFRTAHTLKGSSAAMGFEQMKVLTHEMENVLDQVRNHQLTVTSATVDLLFECLDMLGVLKREIERSGTTHTSTDGIVSRLRSLASQGTGLQIVECRIIFAKDCLMKAARAHVIHQMLNQRGHVLAVSPELEEIAQLDESHEIVFVVETELRPDVLEALVRQEQDIADVHLRLRGAEADALPIRSPDPDSAQRKERIVGKLFKDGKVTSKETEVRHKSGQTIRVDVERLDNLMNLVGELVIDQTRIAQVSGMLRNHEHVDEGLDDLEQISNHIARVISELQESVMKTRMIPIDRLFSRVPRMVRDLAQELAKDIDLVIVGKETELDRTVIEEIGDPLIHLIRNAVDHGIETREQRVAAGKPGKGMVRLCATQQESHVVITVEDDGNGISADKIKATAVKKGLLAAAAADAMGEREAVQLIFAPGFSTASAISDISGRGVGMDIVRAHIEKLNGLIDVETKPGRGTKFTIKLPLTLAIVRGLLVKLHDLTYALPMSSVVEIVRIPLQEIQTVKGRPVVQIREQVMPITWLHDHFHIPRAKRKNKNVFVVVVGIAEQRLGLVVDELIGNQEIVVKSIGSYAGKVEGVSGATILGDGSVALILDVAGVMKLASDRGRVVREEERMAADESRSGWEWSRPTINS